MTDERSNVDDLPQKLGAVLKSDPRFLELVALGEPAPEPEPSCLRCRDRGYLRDDVMPGDPTFGKLVVCECRAPSLVAARVARLWSGAQIPSRYADHTLETYPGDPDTPRVLSEYLEREGRGWLVLAGEHGAGKTGCGVAVLHVCAERGESVLFVNAPVMLRRVRATYSSDSDSESSVIDALCDVDALMIDDVGKERLSQWGAELLYDVVNRRYGGDRRTILTTNLDMHGLEQHVGPATFWRVYERAQWVKLSGNLRRARRG